MVKTEIIDNTYIKHYSDSDLYIQKSGTEEIYTEATDLISVLDEQGWTYTETDTPIHEPTEAEYAEAGRIMMGEDYEND